MAVTTDHQVPDVADFGPGRLLARPRLIAILCVAVLAAAGWVYLGLMVASTLGRGTGLVDMLLPPGGLTGALIDAVCRPSFASPGTGPAARFDLALVFAMWCAMVLAMMLPTAAPMLVAYADIAETAGRQGERVVSPAVLTAGYVFAWIGFAVAASALQWGLTRAALLGPALAPVGGLMSGAIFLLAGAYQFSALKHACLTSCQRPFPFFLANWTMVPVAVLRLGVRQGLYCVGCCWAMMLVMFAVGVMNVLWMAALGVAIAAEKVATTTRLSRAVGFVLGAIGLALVVWSGAAHWVLR